MRLRVVGVVLILLAVAVWWYVQSLFWIAVYPPPLEKRLLEVLSLLLGCAGIVFLILMEDP